MPWSEAPFPQAGRFPTPRRPHQAEGGSLRFMRQAYKDPMNKEDGSWRFIYVGPAGQLIGSLKPPQQKSCFLKQEAWALPRMLLNGPGTRPSPAQLVSKASWDTARWNGFGHNHRLLPNARRDRPERFRI